MIVIAHYFPSEIIHQVDIDLHAVNHGLPANTSLVRLFACQITIEKYRTALIEKAQLIADRHKDLQVMVSGVGPEKWIRGAYKTSVEKDGYFIFYPTRGDSEIFSRQYLWVMRWDMPMQRWVWYTRFTYKFYDDASFSKAEAKAFDWISKNPAPPK